MNLTHLKKLNLAEDLPKQLQALWAELHGVQGGAELEQWVDELLYLDHGINPPKRLIETLLHSFNLRDADSATLSSMLDSDNDKSVKMDGSTFLYVDTVHNDTLTTGSAASRWKYGSRQSTQARKPAPRVKAQRRAHASACALTA